MAAYLETVLPKLAGARKRSDYKLVEIQGIPQNPTFDVAKYEDLIDNFQVKDDDVFIATYVKAGTTWTQQIVHLLLREGESGGFYSETIPWLEATASEMINPREAPTWTVEKINANTSTRYFKTHANVEHLPGKPYNSDKKLKVIYVARNPKDSAVSLYYHAKSKPEFGFTGSFEQFCEIFLAGEAENGDWFNHVIDWYEQCQAHPGNHLFLQYEEMYSKPKECVEKIASFLNIPASPDVIAKVVANSSIDEMRSKASIGLNHLRQGGYGNWRRIFTVAMNEFFDDVYKLRMAGSGLVFNFGPNSLGEDVYF